MAVLPPGELCPVSQASHASLGTLPTNFFFTLLSDAAPIPLVPSASMTAPSGLGVLATKPRAWDSLPVPSH